MNTKKLTNKLPEKIKTHEELDYALLTDPKSKTYGKSHKREILSTTETLLKQRRVDANTIAAIKCLPIETLIMLKVENSVDTFYDYNMLLKGQMDQVLGSTVKDAYWRTVFSDCGSDEKYNMLMTEPVYSKWENRERKKLYRRIRRIAGIDRVKNLKGTETLFPEDKSFTGPTFANYLKQTEYMIRNKGNKDLILFGKLPKDTQLKIYKALTLHEVEHPELYLTDRLTRGADRVRVQERESKERIRNRRRVRKEMDEKHLEHRRREYREKYGMYEELPTVDEIGKTI